MRIARIACGLTAALACMLVACADRTAARQLSGPVDVVEVHRATVCGTVGSAPQITLFADIAALQRWQSTHNLDFFNGGAGRISEGAYALVELGQRNTGGYSVVVSRRAQLRGTTLKLTATFLTPSPGQMTTQMVTSPCVLVALPPVPIQKLTLLDPEGGKRARWPEEAVRANAVPSAAVAPEALPPPEMPAPAATAPPQ